MTYIKNLKPHSIIMAKIAKDYIAFQKIILKPFFVGLLLTAFLTSTRSLHSSFCDSLNSMFSPNLLVFTSLAALFFHILSPWCRISKIISESIYEVASQVTAFLISGIFAALVVMNLQESAITWPELVLITCKIVLSIYFMFSLMTTFPYFLLLQYPITGKNIKEILKNPAMIYVLVFFGALNYFYFSEPSGFDEYDFCNKATCESQ